eukprot:gene13278-13409_t
MAAVTALSAKARASFLVATVAALGIVPLGCKVLIIAGILFECFSKALSLAVFSGTGSTRLVLDMRSSPLLHMDELWPLVSLKSCHGWCTAACFFEQLAK